MTKEEVKNADATDEVKVRWEEVFRERGFNPVICKRYFKKPILCVGSNVYIFSNATHENIDLFLKKAIL